MYFKNHLTLFLLFFKMIGVKGNDFVVWKDMKDIPEWGQISPLQ